MAQAVSLGHTLVSAPIEQPPTPEESVPGKKPGVETQAEKPVPPVTPDLIYRLLK